MSKRQLATFILIAAILALITACSANPIALAPIATSNAPAPTATSSPSSLSFTAIPARPNIIFILADDLDAAEIAFMPKLKSLVVDQGASFSNFFVNVSLCCPSRATTLRGQYVQNTQIFGNSPPDGGFQRVYELGLEKSMVGVWLQSVGYKTMLAGKYLNGYPDRTNLMYIPPGWNEWYSAVKGNAYGEFNYTLNENGKQVQYGNKAEDYGTDVYAKKAIDFIQRTAQEGKPFFVYLAPYAPHSPSTPAPRHEKLFADAQAPRSDNYNEKDVSDKPAYIRALAPLTAREQQRLDEDYRKRLQSLQAVDDAIENIVNALKAAGQLDNTYIFFGSDNGFHLGNHRLLQGKQAPYEEDIRVPMIVRGPGVPAGKTVDYLTGNVDYAPTWAQIAGATIPDFVDGRSLVSLLRANPPAENQWRQVYLIQHSNPDAQPARPTPRATAPARATPTPTGVLEPADPQENQLQVAGRKGITPYVGIRTQNYTYVEYNTGEKELYDLKADPYQLQNLASKSPDLAKALSVYLAQLKKCAGANCRTLESQPLNLPTR